MKRIPLQGAVDLAALAKAKTAPEKVNSPFIVDVTDQSFEQLLTEVSTRVPVILDLWAEWCQPCKQLSPILEKLAAEANGSWVLAKVDIDANPAITQAFKVQSIPAVFLVMEQQVQPLFQQALPESDLRTIITKVLELAAQRNLPGLGIAEPVAPNAEAPLDPAEELMLSGDFAAAEVIYRERLSTNPNDADAKAGIALLSLQQRTAGIDLANLELPVESDVMARMQFADGQILQGNPELAYQVLIETISATSADQKELAKARLLELFDIAEPADPMVLAARRKLASVLY